MPLKTASKVELINCQRRSVHQIDQICIFEAINESKPGLSLSNEFNGRILFKGYRSIFSAEIQSAAAGLITSIDALELGSGADIESAAAGLIAVCGGMMHRRNPRSPLFFTSKDPPDRRKYLTFGG